MFTRSFWRTIAMLTAAGAATFLARSLRQSGNVAEKIEEAAEGVRRTARKAKSAARTAAEETDNGDARRAH
jgi:hypothetical protein